MKNLTTNLILKHFHGFTLEQWNTDLRHKFPYCEVEAITEDVLSALKDAYDLIPDNTESDKLPNIKRLLKEAEHQARQQPSLSELRKTVYEVPDEMKQAIFNKSTEGNAQQPVRKTLDELSGFADWLNNNWFIPAKDGFWKLDTKNIEYQRTIQPKESDFFDSEELVKMYLNNEGES